jgi:hypothetical protein
MLLHRACRLQDSFCGCLLPCVQPCSMLGTACACFKTHFATSCKQLQQPSPTFIFV